jgi:hypothetical protein
MAAFNVLFKMKEGWTGGVCGKVTRRSSGGHCDMCVATAVDASANGNHNGMIRLIILFISL